jgi:translation initiation factor 1
VRLEKGRIVYSSEKGRLCGECGWPEKDCHCSNALGAPEESVPAKITAKVRIEKRASGKSVTVVDGLPSNGPFLEALAKELRKACGAGGHAGEASVELQGDQRERLRELLSRKGWTIKG